MKMSIDRILTTHVGSLPRSKAVTDGVFAKENEQPFDERELATTIASAVDDVVAKQVAVGVDIVSDGEMSKISYATYIKDRITGFEGDSERNPPADLEEFPGFLQRQSSSGGTPSYKRPCCVAEIKVKDMQPLREDLKNMSA
ncbi:MAG: 5-methyltetrahydropteroyltriglutamate--homocysteine methyltransferase, partial [Granulosicoccus sp.]